ncbi:MAG: hypothetical protein HFH30_10625 [Eubacterium sp.]|nr:hypothetical protein [Eubacterium sp.]MCI8919192.1 hypothetical protein [Eubacterium sp.]
MRQMEFKMERTGLLKEGDVLSVTEGRLPNSYYYTLGNAYAMSANYTFRERLKSTEGTVLEVKETPKGFFVMVAFDEEVETGSVESREG